MGVLEFMYIAIAILYMHSYINAIIGKAAIIICHESVMIVITPILIAIPKLASLTVTY